MNLKQFLQENFEQTRNCLLSEDVKWNRDLQIQLQNTSDNEELSDIRYMLSFIKTPKFKQTNKQKQTRGQ